MAHRLSSSQEPPDDCDHDCDAGPIEPMPGDALVQTEAGLLSADEGETEVERGVRLAADRRLVEILAAEGFEGERFDEDFRKLVYKLTGYAWPVLVKWMANGKIFHECQRYRKPVRRPAVTYGWTPDEQCEIATDTIIAAIPFFLDYGLRKDNWDWRRGASLATYFIGACVCQFPKVFLRWWRAKLVAESELATAQDSDDPSVDNPLDLVVGAQPDPATIAVVRDEANRMMKQVQGSQLREVLWRRALGYSQADAAREAGLTEKAAERRLHRHRAKLRDDMPPGPTDPDDGRTG